VFGAPCFSAAPFPCFFCLRFDFPSPLSLVHAFELAIESGGAELDAWLVIATLALLAGCADSAIPACETALLRRILA
jgi:hypothetical protein